MKCTPFEVVYGKSSSSLARYIPRETTVEMVAQDLITRDEALKQLKFHNEHKIKCQSLLTDIEDH